MDSGNINRKARIIQAASITALVGNAFLAAVKIFLGFKSGSFAVVGDGIDSSVDVLIAIMTLVVARVISRPADEDHPWGHGRAETLATAVLGGLLFFAGAQLVLNSAMNLFQGTELKVPSALALIATLISIAGKTLLAWSQHLFGKRADSPMLKANAKNMASDVILSGGVLVGLGLSLLLNLESADSIMAILVGLWVIKSAVGIFMEVNVELMDGATGTGSYQAVFDAVRSVEGAGNPHRARMRRIAGLWDIDLDIEVKPNMTVLEAHWIAHRVEEAIKERVEGVYDIMVHIEPAGNLEDEGYGLTENSEAEEGK
ncbi:cation diffusion facilitator family transporter [Leadbettera azotonutricia]|uniref:Cation efflux family protein n=1 Tax=Leadbettera azotonutricia (strain ATCC BAA-888 / DSM 13862 / ZAS-9) TaxID=545695 RepID=F5Y8L7_LEAAZ|nr:cation diffusion facilitator family transporter [Leadbettera azotonutricia]AEF81347.1 cation efflux family protein [Leadbettera azotonutricia ZAS-9]